MLNTVQSSSTRATFSKRSAWITLVVLLAIAVGLCLVVVWPFAATIIGAAVLAVVYYPLHVRIQIQVPKPRLAALLSTILVLIAFLVPLALLVTTVLQELRAAYQALAPGTDGQGAGRIWAALDRPLAAVGRGSEWNRANSVRCWRRGCRNPALLLRARPWRYSVQRAGA